MKRATVACVAVIGMIAIGGPGSAGGTVEGKRGCGSINLGGPKIFYKHNMTCKSAKQKARRVYETRGADEPRKFNCTSGSGFEDGGDCRHKSKDKAFGWHPAD